MRHFRLPRFSPMVALAVGLVSTATADAQHVSPTPGDLPRVNVAVKPRITKLSAWPGTVITVDRDAWVTAFAVTRGPKSLPIQVLSPVEPAKSARVKAGQQVPLRRLANGEALHLVNYGESPVIVVFASTQPPDLTGFVEHGRWGHNLLLGNIVKDQQAMVDLLGNTIFGYATQYTASVYSASEPSPLTSTASAWHFSDTCTGASAGWVRQVGPAGAGLTASWNDVDPTLRTLVGQSTLAAAELRMANGAPVELKGGARASILPPTNVGTTCRGYRVAWWPRVDRPLPTDSLAGGDALTLPRYPDVIAAPVGSVPASTQSRTAVAGAEPVNRGAPIAPRIIVDYREASRDAQATRSMQGVAKPSSDGSVRPPGGA